MWKINLITGIFLFALGFFIIKFKMTYLIAGYNTSSKKEKYDKDKLVKYIGSLLIISSGILLLGSLLSLFFLRHEANIYFYSNLVFILVMIVGIIYINVSNCTKKKSEIIKNKFEYKCIAIFGLSGKTTRRLNELGKEG